MKIKVMIVDDQVLLAEGIRSVLASSGELEVVSVAHDGQEALDKMQENLPDVVLLDIRMPLALAACGKAEVDLEPFAGGGGEVDHAAQRLRLGAHARKPEALFEARTAAAVIGKKHFDVVAHVFAFKKECRAAAVAHAVGDALAQHARHEPLRLGGELYLVDMRAHRKPRARARFF